MHEDETQTNDDCHRTVIFHHHHLRHPHVTVTTLCIQHTRTAPNTRCIFLSRRAAKRTCIIHGVHTPSTDIASARHRHTHHRGSACLRVRVCLSVSVTHAHTHMNGELVYIRKQVKQVAAKNCIVLITHFGIVGRRTKPNIFPSFFVIQQPVHKC